MEKIRIFNNSMYNIVFFLILVPFFFGCSNKLSRNEAEEQIKQKYQLPKDEFRDFILTEEKALVSWMEYDVTYGGGRYYKNSKGSVEEKSYPKSQLFTTLENENFIIIKIVRQDEPPNTGWGYGRVEKSYKEYYVASFTDKAKPYLNGNSVKTATLEFGEITGIVERKELSMAEVNYTEKRINVTPFGKAYGIIEETWTRSALFTKFDDGWRINN